PGVLQHRVLARQRQELLGIGLARERPQPRPGSARQQYWLQLHAFSRPEMRGSLPFARRQPPGGDPMSQHDDDTSGRDRQRLQWIRTALAEPDTGLERASFDADFRSYWRTTGRSPSLVLMDAPPELMDVRPWLAIRDLPEAGGLRVPAVVARDLRQGFLLLEDLGV